MNSLWAVLRELAGLFIDDGSLVLQIVVVILCAGIASILLPDIPLAAGAILISGCLGALFVNVRATARR